jgi:DNA-binding transcriptional LysR family regulator
MEFDPSPNVMNRRDILMAADIDIDLLRAFLAVADTRSFTAASRLLNRTQSAVSMQIKRLEDVVAGQLFERSARRVDLTRRGEALSGYARRLVALNDEALGKLRLEKLDGIVRLGTVEDYAVHLLPPMLAGFLSAHPGVAIETETGYTVDLLTGLGKRFDIVIGMHPVGTGRGEVVRRDRAVWAGSRHHAVHEQPILPLALHTAGCQFRAAAFAALDRAKRPWRLAYVAQSLGAIEAAAAAGLAVTVAKTGAFPKSLMALGPAEGLPALPTFEIAIHRAPKMKSRAGLALAEYIADSLRDDRKR